MLIASTTGGAQLASEQVQGDNQGDYSEAINGFVTSLRDGDVIRLHRDVPQDGDPTLPFPIGTLPSPIYLRSNITLDGQGHQLREAPHADLPPQASAPPGPGAGARGVRGAGGRG